MGTLSLQFSAVSKLKISVLIKSCWIVTGVCASVKSEDGRLDCPTPSRRLSTGKTQTCLWDLVFPVVMISLLSHEPDAQALICRNYKSYAADWSLNRKPTKFTCQRKSNPRQYRSPLIQKCSILLYVQYSNILNSYSDLGNASRVTSFNAFICNFSFV